MCQVLCHAFNWSILLSFDYNPVRYVLLFSVLYRYRSDSDRYRSDSMYYCFRYCIGIAVIV